MSGSKNVLESFGRGSKHRGRAGTVEAGRVPQEHEGEEVAGRVGHHFSHAVCYKDQSHHRFYEKRPSGGGERRNPSDARHQLPSESDVSTALVSLCQSFVTCIPPENLEPGTVKDNILKGDLHASVHEIHRKNPATVPPLCGTSCPTLLCRRNGAQRRK